MRKEASTKQWEALYENTTRIKELKPWEKFWDMDLIYKICGYILKMSEERF